MPIASLTVLDGGSRALHLLESGAPLSWSAVFRGLQTDPALRDALTGALRDAAHRAGFAAVRPVVEIRGRCGACGSDPAGPA